MTVVPSTLSGAGRREARIPAPESLAGEAARKDAKEAFIGTEHLLLAVVIEADDNLSAILTSRGIEIERVRSEIEKAREIQTEQQICEQCGNPATVFISKVTCGSGVSHPLRSISLCSDCAPDTTDTLYNLTPRPSG